MNKNKKKRKEKKKNEYRRGFGKVKDFTEKKGI